MVRDVDNHGHKIWTPFGSSAADGGVAVLGGGANNINSNGNNSFNDAQKIEFVLHKNIINSVRVYACNICVFSSSSSTVLLLLSLSLCVCVCVCARLTMCAPLFCKLQEYFVNALVPTEDIDDLIDEIYNEVSDVEPWMSGNARGASTAFCILYRILAMENVPHFKINKMIYHRDSVYIRCIGLLYARYKFYNDEERLMKFFGEEVFGDTMDASFSPSVDKKKLTSFSQFAIDLICSQEYFETLFPRIPEVLKRKIQAKIETWLNVPKVEAKGGGGIGEWRRSKGDGKGRVMSVKESLSVNVGQRAPHLANARERGRSGFDPESNRSFNRDRDRDRGRGDGGGGKFRGRDRSRDRRNDDDRYHHHHHHHRNRGGGGGGGDRRDGYRRSYDDYDDYDDDRDRRRRDDSRERRRRGGDREERELPYARELPYKR